MARLLPSRLRFDRADDQAWYWLPVDAPLTVHLGLMNGYEVSVFDADGIPASSRKVELTSDSGRPGVAVVSISEPAERYYLRVARSGQGPTQSEVEAAVQFSDLWRGAERRIESKTIVFPTGEPVGDDEPPFAFGEYIKAEEIALTFCPAPVARGGPLSRRGGPDTPPAGAEQNENFCGPSVFINSMEKYFPGALPADVRTSSRSWDRVSTSLDHSNWFGTRGDKMVDNINGNYGRSPSAADNGRLYCAKVLRDESVGNVEAWTVDCNVKLLIYDFLEVFGHWVDIDSVSGSTFRVEDYTMRYPVEYDEANGILDFSAAPLNSGAGGEFNGADAKVGDDFFEPFYFVAVCECDTSSGRPSTPTTNSRGDTLNP